MDNLTELYCHIDDFYQAFKPEFERQLIENGTKRLRACKISVPEIMTILVLFHQLRYRQFKGFYYHHMLGMMKKDFPNLPLLGENTVFSNLVTNENGYWMRCVIIGAVVLIAKLVLDLFFSTEAGLSMRATGSNLRMAQAQGINTSWMTIIGMAISNALVALGGALFVQTQGGADISIGIGTIVIGLAAVIIGETIIPAKRIWLITFAVVIGAIIYKLFIQVALSSDTLRSIGFGSQDLNLITALLVVIALQLPSIKSKLLSGRRT